MVPVPGADARVPNRKDLPMSEQPEVADEDDGAAGFFEEFEGLPLDERVETARSVLEGDDEDTDEFAVETVERLVGPLRHAGQVDVLEQLIDALEAGHAERVAEDPWLVAQRRAENALLAPDLELAPRVEALAALAPDYLDDFCLFIDRCRYHGLLEELVAYLPAVIEAVLAEEPDEDDEVAAAFFAAAGEVALDELITRRPDIGPDDDELAHRLETFGLVDSPWVPMYLEARSGALAPDWQARPPCTEGWMEGDGALLAFELARDLTERFGWPPARAELARRELSGHLRAPVAAFDDPDGEPGDLSPEQLVLGDAGRLAELIRGGTDLDEGGYPHATGALVLALPAFLEHVVERGLVSEEQSGAFWEELFPVLAEVPSMLQELGEDPILTQEVEDALLGGDEEGDEAAAG